MDNVKNLIVWDDHPTIESDHTLISIDICIDKAEVQKQSSTEVGSNSGLSQRMIVWKKKRGDPQAWYELSQQLIPNMENWNDVKDRTTVISKLL